MDRKRIHYSKEKGIAALCSVFPALYGSVIYFGVYLKHKITGRKSDL